MAEELIGGPPPDRKAPGEAGSDDEALTGQVRLSLPALPDFARIARVAAAGLATRAGFSYDEVEDVRIAMGEVCTLLVDATADDAELAITYDVVGDELRVDARGLAPDRASGIDDLRAPDLSARIMAAVVDSHEVRSDGISFVKRRADR